MKVAIVALIVVLLCVEHASAIRNGPGKDKKPKDKDGKDGKEGKGGHGGDHGKEHWGYKHGGTDWTGAKCQKNLRQSPVNIISTLAKKEGKAPVFKYKSTKAKIFNNGHVLQVEAESAGGLGSVTYNGNEYEVLQFHFHNPGEHKIDNKRYPLELHIVHRKKGSQGMNDLLVVGVNFESALTANNAFIASLKPKGAGLIGDFYPTSGDPKDTKPLEKVDLNSIKALKNSDLYNYQGSLTTPTCDDTVTWFVAKTPEKISNSALGKFEKLFSKNPKFAGGRGNNRIIQTANTPGVEGSERQLFVVHTAF